METILVVDDSPVIRRMIRLILRKQGLTVLTATDGEDALRYLDDRPVSLALIDINMPKMNGLALLRHIRQGQRYAALPVVMLTSSEEETDRDAARKQGANGFLNKPAGTRELLGVIETLLDTRSAP